MRNDKLVRVRLLNNGGYFLKEGNDNRSYPVIVWGRLSKTITGKDGAFIPGDQMSAIGGYDDGVYFRLDGKMAELV